MANQSQSQPQHRQSFGFDTSKPIFLFGFAAGLCCGTVAIFIALIISNYNVGSLDDISKLAGNNTPGILSAMPNAGHRWEELRYRLMDADARAERREAIKEWLETHWPLCVWAILVPGSILYLTNKPAGSV